MSHTDVHQTVTDRIVAAIEAGAGGTWQRPWTIKGGGRRPANIASGRSYRGINTVALWAEALLAGYSSHVWGSYRQWTALGGQVRKGEKAAQVVFFKEVPLSRQELTDSQADEPTTRLFARSSPVFNADQVDGLATLLPPAPAEGLPSIDRFVENLHAEIVHGGDQACYMPCLDLIRMPDKSAFISTATSTATEGYYSTLAHELTHWTAPQHRCSRDLHQRFQRDAYAMEELVAELGAAFLCADLGLATEPRPDHAQYLAHWLRVLKADKRAIFTASSKAAQAVDFLLTRAAQSDTGSRRSSLSPESAEAPATQPGQAQ